MTRLQVLKARLAGVERQIEAGRVSVTRGGRDLLRKRANLDAAGLSETGWRQQREAARLFLTADGEAGRPWGNETIRLHPDEGWLEVKLPGPLAHLANRPHGRYRLSCPAQFPYRGDEVAAQAATGAIRYDISLDPASGRWYLDASWKTAPAPAASLGELRHHRVIAVDVNAGHLAAAVLTPDGNVTGTPVTVPLDLAGLPAATRDGRPTDVDNPVEGVLTGLCVTGEEAGRSAYRRGRQPGRVRRGPVKRPRAEGGELG